MIIKQCVICHKDFAPITGNQIKCPLCRQVKPRKTEVMQRICIVCGKTFSTDVYNRKFCSRTCREAYHYTPITKENICYCCGKRFVTTKSNKKYCSDPCAQIAKAGKLKYKEDSDAEQYGEN